MKYGHQWVALILPFTTPEDGPLGTCRRVFCVIPAPGRKRPKEVSPAPYFVSIFVDIGVTGTAQDSLSSILALVPACRFTATLDLRREGGALRIDKICRFWRLSNRAGADVRLCIKTLGGHLYLFE